MKTGASPVDINRITELALDGFTVEQVSDELQIEQVCVKSFFPKAADIKAAKKEAEKVDGE